MQLIRRYRPHSSAHLAMAAICAALLLALPAMGAESSATQDYTIGPGDVLQIAVFGEQDLTGAYRVEPGGTISLPYSDTPLMLAGATLAEAQARVTQQLARVLKRPRVTVTLDEAKSLRIVTVMGAVLAPGVVELPIGATAFSAIAKAGGFAPDAGADAVLLLRPSGEGQRLDLGQMSGDAPATVAETPDARAPVHSGDSVWVPRSTHRITVLGPVARPGRFAIRKGEPLTVLDAVSALGGGAAEGTKLGSAMLVRQEGKAESIDLRKLLLEGDLSQNVALGPGDTVIVCEAERIAVVGAVNTPTSFAPDANSTLVDALSRASGLTARADLRNASVIRGGEHIPVNVEAVWLRGDMDKDVPLRPGDIVLVPEVDNQVVVTGEVQKPGAYEVQLNSRLLSLLTAAGGPTTMADLSHASILREGNTISVNLQRMFEPGQTDVAGAAAENVPVLPGDVVFVPRGGVAYVLGAVMKPGAFAVHEGSTVVDAIAAAGGVAPFGASRNIVLARRGEQGEPTLTQLDMDTLIAKGTTDTMLQLRPGDILYVETKKRPRSFTNFRDIIYGASGLLWALF